MLKYFLVIICFAISCGSADQDEQNVKDTTEVTYLGKKVRLKNDVIYGNNCTPGLTTAFVMTKSNGACNKIEINSDYTKPITYTIKSSDAVIDLKMIENDDGTAMIGDTKYFCLNFSGNAYTSKGEIKTFGSHLVLSKSKVSKPSEIKTDDVDYVFPSDDDFCEALSLTYKE